MVFLILGMWLFDHGVSDGSLAIAQGTILVTILSDKYAVFSLHLLLSAQLAWDLHRPRITSDHKKQSKVLSRTYADGTLFLVF